MQSRRVKLHLLLVFAIGCEPTTTSSGAPNTQSEACVVRANLNPAAVTDGSGPYYHQVVIGTTTDGANVANRRQVLEHASVPDGVRLSDGRVLIYYVNGERGSVWIAQVNDQGAQPISSLIIDNIADPAGIVDPDAHLTPEGRVRLFYLAGFGPPNSGTNRAICAAESTDGIHFQTIGTALTMTPNELLTDPSVVRLPNGGWRMAISLGQRTVMATSSDGLNFTRTSTLDFGGVPELGITNDGRLRLYVCAQGIVSYISTDGGANWIREATVIAPPTTGLQRIVCDPSFVPGASLFVYKTG